MSLFSLTKLARNHKSIQFKTINSIRTVTCMTLNMSNIFYNVDSKNSTIQRVLRDTQFTKLIMLEILHCKVRNYFSLQNYFSKHSSHQKKFLIKVLCACVAETVHVCVCVGSKACQH
jgi:hypothetical protein